MFVEKRPQKKKFLMTWHVIRLLKKQCLNLKLRQFYNLLDTLSNQLKTFQSITTVVQKFKILDPKLFLQKSFNECEETLSELTDIYESDTEKEDLVPYFKYFCLLFKQMQQDLSFQTFIIIICDV